MCMLSEESGFSAAVDNNFDGHDRGSLCAIHPFQNPHPNNASLNKTNSTHDWVADMNSCYRLLIRLQPAEVPSKDRVQ